MRQGRRDVSLAVASRNGLSRLRWDDVKGRSDCRRGRDDLDSRLRELYARSRLDWANAWGGAFMDLALRGQYAVRVSSQ